MQASTLFRWSLHLVCTHLRARCHLCFAVFAVTTYVALENGICDSVKGPEAGEATMFWLRLPKFAKACRLFISMNILDFRHDTRGLSPRYYEYLYLSLEIKFNFASLYSTSLLILASFQTAFNASYTYRRCVYEVIKAILYKRISAHGSKWPLQSTLIILQL